MAINNYIKLEIQDRFDSLSLGGLLKRSVGDGKWEGAGRSGEEKLWLECIV